MEFHQSSSVISSVWVYCFVCFMCVIVGMLSNKVCLHWFALWQINTPCAKQMSALFPVAAWSNAIPGNVLSIRMVLALLILYSFLHFFLSLALIHLYSLLFVKSYIFWHKLKSETTLPNTVHLRCQKECQSKKTWKLLTCHVIGGAHRLSDDLLMPWLLSMSCQEGTRVSHREAFTLSFSGLYHSQSATNLFLNRLNWHKYKYWTVRKINNLWKYFPRQLKL